MEIVPWALAVFFAVSIAVLYSMWRRGLTDRHCLLQYTFLILLHPETYDVQRARFLNLVRTMREKNEIELGASVAIALDACAREIAAGSAASNARAIWKVNQELLTATDDLSSN